MYFDKHNTYLFHNIDRHGLIINKVQDMMFWKFTMLVEIVPDLQHIKEKLKTEDNFQQCIIGKNGKHTGLFLCAYVIDETIHFNLEYQWWELGGRVANHAVTYVNEDVFKNLILPIHVEENSKFEVVVERTENEITVKANGNSQTSEYGDLIDYSTALMWLGAANRLNDTLDAEDPYNNIYVGEINKLHLQDKPLDPAYQAMFFNDYEKFLDLKLDVKRSKIYITTDFSEVSPYKILDQSGNGNHPVIYKDEWLR